MMDLDDTLYSHCWSYIGSGSANVVLCYNGVNSIFKGKAIRLRLKNTDVSTTEIYSYIHSKRFDKLREYMVNMEILNISEKFLYYIQNYLNENNIKLQLDLTENKCLIMKNIFPTYISDYKIIKLSKYHTFFINSILNEVLFEFKPKWLYKMPTDHINCRNCLIARSKGQEFIPCHLKLINYNDPNGIDEWCYEISIKLKQMNEENLNIYKPLKECIKFNFTIVKTLYELQNNINIHERILSLNSQKDVDDDLQFNMTLRDCSLMMNLTL
ncbi:Inositol-pentakisphosphate 2-kinase [Pichia californica]|uniref:Inositol-pentakisphosphate 2-kinase n=1 Tax=Pichia californica TaxID=460514 RepID=A0A9P7BFZ4_9ASCO|nr:Inositol-pentakisphosphate 2-kinase [[Candida] californica]KAG0689431.1 Inositol-pentakisphosphate 2-kinase [[Candida] californica]